MCEYTNEMENKNTNEIITSQNAYTPDVDIYDTKDELLVVADIPGVSKGDVSIEIDENNILFIRAKTSFKEPDGKISSEFQTGNYFKAFSISNDFNKDAIQAKLENGVLEISVPRKEEAKPRKISINA
jgi:HSP20 family protein